MPLAEAYDIGLMTVKSVWLLWFPAIVETAAPEPTAGLAVVQDVAGGIGCLDCFLNCQSNRELLFGKLIHSAEY